MSVESIWLHISGYYLDCVERKFIVRVKSNQERMSCSFPDDIGTSRSAEIGLKAQLEGDVMYETVREGRRLETGEQRTYEYISLQTDASIQNLQKNVAYEVVDFKSNMQTLELQENVAYEKLKTTFDHEENVPYQGTDRLQHKDLSLVYEAIMDVP